DVSKFITKLFPVFNKFVEWFNKAKNVVTDFIGLTSEAGRELDRLKKANESLFSSMSQQIEIMKMQGATEEEIYKRNIELIQLKREELIKTAQVNGSLTEEEIKQLQDLNNQQISLYYGEKNRLKDLAKTRSDEAKTKAKERADEYKRQLDELNKYYKDAENIIYASNNNQRNVELKNIEEKYNLQLDQAKKLGKDVGVIEEALRIERDKINKKYDDEYFQYINENQTKIKT